MFVERPFWKQRIAQAWSQASIVWLAGVRRSGKTTLVKSLAGGKILYLNCDLPSVADLLADPELFYRECEAEFVAMDEIHQLSDPSRLLKIAADEFPHLKVIATGSSTLAASRKFRDTLAGRKRLVHLTPVLWDELEAFGDVAIQRRLSNGGLPPALLMPDRSPEFYREWMDSFFARDIQRLFGFRDSHKFTSVLEYVMKQSGGLLETARASRALALSRQTVDAHLRALETTQAVTLLRPFHGGAQKELTRMPKVYGFDTGFVAFCRGWEPPRQDDYGPLWEHLVLEHLQAHAHDREIHHWRDTAGREIDFVIPRGRTEVDAIECKWSPDQLAPDSLAHFRAHYPRGSNYLITPGTARGHTRRFAGLEVHVCDPAGWLAHVARRNRSVSR